MLITHASHLDNTELTAELSRLAPQRARGYGGPDRAPRGVRRAPPVRGRGLLLAVQVLHGRPSPLRRRRLQPDQGGAGGPPLSRHHRAPRERRAEPNDRASPRAAPDAREPRGAPGRRLGQGQAGRRGVAGAPIPAARRCRACAQGPEPADATGCGRLANRRRRHDGVSSPSSEASRSRLRLRSRLVSRRRSFWRYPPLRARWSVRSRPSGTRSASRPVGSCAKSCASLRTCSGMQFPAATSLRSSTGR